MEEDVDIREKAFHGAVREYIVCLLIFLCLYFWSYAIIKALKKRNDCDDLYGGDEEDYAVYRISFWICTFSMAVSIAAVLLVPFSICSNEILLRYPRSYYIQWLNDSLVHSLWNYVFLLSNLCLFLFLPFAYFFIESQGFTGSRKGLMTRVYEACALCALLIILVFCLARLVSIFIILYNDEQERNESLFKFWNYQLPFVYSCISMFGVVLLLSCTPLGVATMFSFVGELVVKPKFRKDVENERFMVMSEEESLKRKLKFQQGDRFRTASQSEMLSQSSSPFLNGFASLGHSELIAKINELERRKDYLLKQSRSWLWLQNLKYPIVMIVLLLLTGVSVLMVITNIFELCVGFRSLPRGSEKIELGISSLSLLGAFGAIFEAIIILYLMAASLVGFYSVPILKRLRPIVRQTSMTKVICNCMVLIILSSALPVLARILGITTFDLLGDYGRLDGLGNFYLVLSYNVVFATATGLCLVTKFTSKIRKELFNRFNEAGVHLTKRRGRQLSSVSTTNARSFSVDSMNIEKNNMQFVDAFHGKYE